MRSSSAVAIGSVCRGATCCLPADSSRLSAARRSIPLWSHAGSPSTNPSGPRASLNALIDAASALWSACDGPAPPRGAPPPFVTGERIAYGDSALSSRSACESACDSAWSSVDSVLSTTSESWPFWFSSRLSRSASSAACGESDERFSKTQQ